jgi:hypothetical protein
VGSVTKEATPGKRTCKKEEDPYVVNRVSNSAFMNDVLRKMYNTIRYPITHTYSINATIWNVNFDFKREDTKGALVKGIELLLFVVLTPSNEEGERGKDSDKERILNPPISNNRTTAIIPTTMVPNVFKRPDHEASFHGLRIQ